MSGDLLHRTKSSESATPALLFEDSPASPNERLAKEEVVVSINATDRQERPPGSKPPMIVWMDLVRTLGIILVVLSHCSGGYRKKIHALEFYEWFWPNFYTAIMRPAVPFFFMVSGYILLHRSEPLGLFFKRRVSKVAVPLVFWSLFYLCWNKWYLGEGFKDWQDALYILSTDLTSNHLWFLFAILGCYAGTPFLRVAFRHVEPHVALFTLGLWLISDPLSISLKTFYKLSPPVFKFLEFPHGYIGYYFAGGVLKFYPTLTEKQLWLANAVYAVSVTATVVGSGQRLYWEEDWQDPYGHQQSAFVAVQSLSLFLLVRHIGERPFITESHRLATWFRSCSEQSFGIYLVHIAVLHYTARNFFNDLAVFVGIKILIHVVVVMALGYVFSWLTKRVPVLREIVP
eukprot:TRINITY_DN4100_c0_g1_i1.p1 TRINITY_DN4100_c0_g1~~TRINITY_DN4100_c0_g1_i1.p1  ORF type:complete len:401 (+),score=104.30 TRINITY_DN4100_c0_g1_i1:78-1280(+)